MSGHNIRGDRLVELRNKRNLTQRELADMLQMGEKEIWRYENVASNPTALTITKLAKFFEVSTDYLLGIETQEREMTPDERHIIDAIRRGDDMAAIRIIAKVRG